MMNKLTLLNSQMVLATKRLELEMAKIYPVGSVIQFMIIRNQRRPSTGKVISYNAPYLRVKMDTDIGKVKDVHFDSVLP